MFRFPIKNDKMDDVGWPNFGSEENFVSSKIKKRIAPFIYM